MSTENCILTTKDFTILEVMRDRRVGTDDPLTPILERKLATATGPNRPEAAILANSQNN